MSIALGAASPYAVLTDNTIIAGGVVTVTGGNVGCSAIVGSVTIIGGSLNTSITPASPEIVDATTAFTVGMALIPGLGNTYPGGSDLAVVLPNPVVPGVYKVLGNATIGSSLTFNGAGLYASQIEGILTVNPGITITLTNSASQCNIFWF